MSTADGAERVAEFAALLTELKARTGRSYGSLARRLGMNTSTLHRYCAGEAVPQDFAPLERLAEFCGATAEERLELHRRWLAAVAVRQAAARPQPTAPAPAPATAPATAPTESETPVVEAGAGEVAEVPETVAVSAGGVPRARPWYRRRAGLVVAVGCVVAATLGTLSALPGGRPSDSVAGTGASPSAVAPGRTTAPAAPRPSSSATVSPSGSPSGTSPATPPTATPPGTRRTPSPRAESGNGSKPPAGSAAGTPLTWSADSQVWANGCGHDYVIGRPPAEVPPPPAPQDAGPWAAAQGAVHGRETQVQISVQGRGSTAVVLTALRVRVVGRTAPAPGNAYAMDRGCGGALTPRFFSVDLDKDRPIARSVAGNDSGTPIPAVRMPYRVSAEDPEVLLVTARTESCDCSWYLELDWSSQGRTGTVRIDDAGRPFRTRSITGLPRYLYDTSARKWAPYS
ncbi:MULTISPECIES: helix-turn-helix domain-containing protein [unclassified Streptomyces]|uniref:helix-turn-helix domain-containing protein n=1 Tax=unclassified Streptomyces TaxID=2593676 RepID=UPI0037F3CD74